MNHRQLALAHFNRAAKYYQRAIYVQAIRHYLAGLKIDAARAEIYADLAKAYEMLGCWNQALEALEVALRLQPSYPIALRRQRRIREEKKIYEALEDELGLDQESEAPTPCQHQQVERDKGLRIDKIDPGKSLASGDADVSPGPDPFVGANNPTIHNQSAIEHQFFTLTYPDTIPHKTIWTVCQLIERTYHEVGKIFHCYPHHPIPFSIEDASQLSCSSPRHALPPWAAARYDGGIQLTYRSYGNSRLGILSTLIRHEWVHLIVDLLTQGRCPAWLDEGLAQTIARLLMNSEREYLLNASRNQQLLAIDALKKPFSQIDAKGRRLAYLQSSATVEYLIKQFGISQIRELLKRIGNGTPSEIAIQKTFGKTAVEIIAAWRMGIDGMNRETQGIARKKRTHVQKWKRLISLF